jgi:N-acetylmuramoyl-L-alanine amidase
MGFRAYLALALALVAPALGVRAEEAPSVASAVELTDQGVFARLTFDISRAVAATARPVADPGRIVIDLGEVDFQVDPAKGRFQLPRSDAIVKGFRFGALEPGKSRIVVDLNRTACIVRLESDAGAPGSTPARLSLLIRPCEARKFAAATRGPPDVSVPAATESPVALPVIVLDPGHGGPDGGASDGKGDVEKAIVFEFALEAKRQLEATHQFKVVLTRNGDDYVSLEDRVKIARGADAALMISIHADTLPRGSNEVSGTTVYTCSERASDAEAARIAEHENAADPALSEGKPADSGVADILFDLKRRETRAYAHIFSRGLVSELSTLGRLNHNPQRSAGFVVLKAPDFPSVLVELGYLSNPRDVVNMVSLDWRQRAATAMVAAVKRFFEPNANPKGDGDKTSATLAGSERPAAH